MTPSMQVSGPVLCPLTPSPSVPHLHPQVKKGAFAISLTKGMRVRSDGPQLISQMVTK